MSEEARFARPQVAQIGWRCMNARMALHACAKRRSSPAHFIAARTEAGESCGIMRAVSAAESAVPWARIPA